ncbi:MAG: chorismate synthase [Clostridia bacterium]|nr:chorismate synthase [Clostridia bacterium]
MKNTIGQSVAVTLFGESHGEEIGCVIDGLAPGIPVKEDAIAHALSLRRPAGRISTARVESDSFRIVSGVFRGVTTGTPLCILIPNSAKRSTDYENAPRLARPGHADYTAHCKYHGFEDFRGGGHFSGRITAPLVAAGAIAKEALAALGITLGTHISSLGEIRDRDFADLAADFAALNETTFPVLDDARAAAMQEYILAAAGEGDSVGGVLETVVLGMPSGVGEPYFDSVESQLSHMLFSVPAVKGVEFGDGFALTKMRGSEANDPMRAEGNGATTLTNRAGGIYGGITNGAPIVFRTAVKPTPSIYKEQLTVSLDTGKNETLALGGRHDPCIVHRARAVIDAVTALVLCDLLAQRYGTDYLSPKK